ncbi:MAG: hypothetical protein ACFB0B_11170 [Thermonemataceae bacterium]
MSKEKFRDLKKLAKVIKEATKRTLPVLDLKAERTLEDEFFRKILQVENEEALVSQLYDTTNTKHHPYRVLRDRFEEKALNNLLLIDYTKVEMNVSEKEKLIAIKQFYLAEVLIATNQPELAKKLLKEALEVFITYEKPSLQLEVLKHLLSPKFTNFFKEKEIVAFQKLATQSNITAFYDNESSLLMREINTLVVKADTKARTPIKELEIKVARLKELWETTQLSIIYFRYLWAQVVTLQTQGKWEAVLAILDTSEALIKSKKLNLKVFKVGYISNVKVFTLAMLKRYEEAVTYGQAQLKYFGGGNYNTYIFQLNYAQALSYAGHYQQVFNLIETLEKSANWSVVISRVQEEFYLIKAYATFLLDQPVDFTALCDKMARLHQKPLGMNLNLRILELLLDLKRQDRLSFERNLKNLKNSWYAHTKKKQREQSRTNRFLIMLSQIVSLEHTLSLAQLKDKSRYHYNKLRQQPLEGVVKTDFEPVPYEQLWDYILHLLQTQSGTYQSKI